MHSPPLHFRDSRGRYLKSWAVKTETEKNMGKSSIFKKNDTWKPKLMNSILYQQHFKIQFKHSFIFSTQPLCLNLKCLKSHLDFIRDIQNDKCQMGPLLGYTLHASACLPLQLWTSAALTLLANMCLTLDCNCRSSAAALQFSDTG